MKKITYIIISIIAVCVSIAFLLLGAWPLKIIGGFLILMVFVEYSTGKYKKYITSEVSEKEAQEQKKQFKSMLLPFIIIGIIVLGFIIFLVIRNLLN